MEFLLTLRRSLAAKLANVPPSKMRRASCSSDPCTPSHIDRKGETQYVASAEIVSPSWKAGSGELLNVVSTSTSFDLSSWVLYSLAMAAALCSGLVYIFGIISEILHRSGFTPSQIDLIFGLGTFGQYFGLLPGFMADRIGVTVTMAYGLLCTTLGYGLILPLLSNSVCTLTTSSPFGFVALLDLLVSRAFQYSDYALPPPCYGSGSASPRSQLTAILLGLSIFFIAQGGVAIHYSTLPVLLKKCIACKRGLVSGTLAAGYGGSAILWSALYGTAFHGTDQGRPYILSFLFVIGAAMTIITCLIIFRFLLLPETPFSTVPSLHESTPKQSPTPIIRTMPSIADGDETLPKRRAGATAFSFELDKEFPGSNSKNHCDIVPEQGGESFTQLALSGRFVMYFLATAFMQGTCAATMGNVSMLRDAYDYDAFHESSAINTTSRMWSLTRVVRLLSIGNFSGRILAAFVSQYVHTAKYHRFFLLTGILIASSQLLFLAFPFNQHIFLICLFFTACCLGTNFAIGPVWVMQNISITHFASLQAVVMCGVAAATFGLSIMTGGLYEVEAVKQAAKRLSEEHLVCRGPACFRFTHTLEFMINVVSIGLVLGVK